MTILDSWLSKSHSRFTNGGYFDSLTQGVTAIYPAKAEPRNVTQTTIEKLWNEMHHMPDEALKIAAFIGKYYDLGLNGLIFGESTRFVRSLPIAKENREKPIKADRYDLLTDNSIARLIREPLCRKQLLDTLHSISKDNFEILSTRPAVNKSYGGSDKKFLSKELIRHGYTQITTARQANKNNKCFATENVNKILAGLGIKRPSKKKSPDWMVRNGNIIYVGEDKYQVESGGSQGGSKGDGISVFSYQNNSTFTLRKVFCFDGDFEELTSTETELISSENKIMSLFDVVEYIESAS